MKLVNIRSKFQEPPLLKNFGIYDKTELNKSIINNQLKLLYFQTSSLCDLWCIYCPTKSWKKKKWELTKEEREKVLVDFKKLWWEIIHYIWEWEPLVDPLFWSDYDIIKKLWLKIVIFTHWWNLNKDTIIKLNEIDASIILKYHSHNEIIQDLMANKKWYAKKRDNALNLLIEYWFNKWDETRLGLDILVMKPNIKDITRYWKYCRDNNIFPMVKKIFFSEKAWLDSVKKSLDVESNKFKALFYELSEIDRREYWYFWIPSPPWAAIKCNYYFYHIFVTNLWFVRPCIWVNDIWNIRKQPLEYYRNSPEMNSIKGIPDNPSWKCITCINNIVDKCYWCPCRKLYNNWSSEIGDISKWDNCFSSCWL